MSADEWTLSIICEERILVFLLPLPHWSLECGSASGVRESESALIRVRALFSTPLVTHRVLKETQMIRSVVRWTTTLALIAVPVSHAWAEDTEPEAAEAEEAPPVVASAEDMEAAKKTLTAYLDAVKAKKWDAAKKLIHPKTIDDIARIKKRMGRENHGLAPWARVKEAFMTNYTLGDPKPTADGAVVVPSTEEEHAVVENGDETGIQAEYLLIPLSGTWYVTDRRLGENKFPESTVGVAYEGYFEGQYEPPKPPAKKSGKSGKKKK